MARSTKPSSSSTPKNDGSSDSHTQQDEFSEMQDSMVDSDDEPISTSTEDEEDYEEEYTPETCHSTAINSWLRKRAHTTSSRPPRSRSRPSRRRIASLEEEVEEDGKVSAPEVRIQQYKRGDNHTTRLRSLPVDSPHIVGFQDEELLSDQYDDGDYNSETQGDIDSLWELEAAALHQSEASNKGERPFQNVGAGFARDQPYEEDTASEVAKDESFDPEEIIGGDDGYVVPPDVDHNRSSARSGFSAGTSFAERLRWVEDDNLNPNMSLIEPFAVNIGEDDLIFHLAAEGFRDTSRPLISPATGRQMRLPWMPYRIHHRIRDELIADMLASGAETRDIMDQFDPAALENVHNNPDEYADLKAVSAIRGKLSQRITRFRDRIGVLPVGGASRKKDTSKNKIVVRNNNVTANEELTFRRLSYEQNLVGVRGTYDSNTGTYNDNGVTHVAPIPANPPQRWIGTLNAVGRVTQGFIVHDYINSTGVFQGRPFPRYPFP
ncbi:hypothetical protein LTS18_002731 [Coniosporium uncinatum]|uniref:Uncharacterized protein n=1 Tax=Coniosporium uncinatum TaxID=93489 RepID=A0ACC3DBL4_9PEZI|nr:hypothetical protein LTS18_002731 [Coniosporium uncinatum]